MNSIQNAFSAGFRVINVGPGSHSVSAISDEVCLIFHPGQHSLTNAPVQADRAISIRGLNPVPNKFSSVGAAYITAPGSVSSYFNVGFLDQSVYPRGTHVSNLMFDMNRPTGQAIFFTSLNYGTVEDNVFLAPAGTYKTAYGLKNYMVPGSVEPDNDGDMSWNRWHRNWAIGCPLLWSYNHRNQWSNRNDFTDNVGTANGVNGSLPYLRIQNRSPGWLISGNHFEDLSSSAAAAIHCGPNNNGHYILGNSFDNINTTNNIAILCDDIAAGIIFHSRGASSTNGELRMINIENTADKTYSGEWNLEDNAKNRIVVIDRYDNL